MHTKDKTPLRLHIGGVQVKTGWKILNAVPGPGVDYVGDVRQLTQFPDGSCAELYCSHILEHLPFSDLLPTLVSLHRILVSGGKISISVPDMKILCEHYLDPRLSERQRFQIMLMMFGGQKDDYDFHHIGFNYDLLSAHLARAGFTRIQQVESFGEFDDISGFVPFGRSVSLNVVSFK